VRLVDSNVLVDVFGEPSRWREWAMNQLIDAAVSGGIAINPVIYAEVAAGFTRIETLETCLAETGAELLDIPRPALFLASQQFRSWRRHGEGQTPSILPDFMIGAHAAILDLPLVTRDTRRYRSSFPTVQLISP